MWSGVSSLGKTRLAFLKGNQDAFDYQQTLTNHLFEFIDNVHDGDYVFQHDNASIHRANATKPFLADLNIKIMGWPTLFPDLNSIENLCGIMARRVYKNARQYFSITELKVATQLIWDEISDDLLLKLTNSMFDRCLAVVRSKGTNIAY